MIRRLIPLVAALARFEPVALLVPPEHRPRAEAEPQAGAVVQVDLAVPDWPTAAMSSSGIRAGGSPERFAEVTAIGPSSRANARGTGWSGTRKPNVARPPVTASGTSSGRTKGSTNVSAPGQ